MALPNPTHPAAGGLSLLADAANNFYDYVAEVAPTRVGAAFSTISTPLGVAWEGNGASYLNFGARTEIAPTGGSTGSMLTVFRLSNSAGGGGYLGGKAGALWGITQYVFSQQFFGGFANSDTNARYPDTDVPGALLSFDDKDVAFLITWDGTTTVAAVKNLTDDGPVLRLSRALSTTYGDNSAILYNIFGGGNGALPLNSASAIIAQAVWGSTALSESQANTLLANPVALWTAFDDTTPTLTGAITEVSKTENSISISWPAGADNVAVTRYEVSTNGGSSWTDTGNTTLSRTFTGLTASTAYAIHVRAKDAAGNVSTPALTTSITTLAPDTTAPSFGAATLSAGTKTNSSIALSTSAVATDNVAVTGYEWSSDNGATYPFTSLSNSFTFTALTALTAYNFRVRAYDGAGNRSTHLSLTTSTYRAGDTGQFIIDNTGPVGGNPAGILYNDVVLPGDADKWFSFLITTPPANAGSLTIDPQGRFTWVGMSADSFYYQLEVEGANVGSPVLVSLGPAGPTPLNATKRTPNGMIGFWNR